MKLTDIVEIAFVDTNYLYIDALNRKFNGLTNSEKYVDTVLKSPCQFTVASIFNQNEGVPVLPIFYDFINGKIEIGASYGFEEEIEADIESYGSKVDILKPYSSHIFRTNREKFPNFPYAIYSMFKANDLTLSPQEKTFSMAKGIFDEIVRIKLESSIEGVEKILIPGLYSEHVSEEEAACLVYRAYNRVNATKLKEL